MLHANADDMVYIWRQLRSPFALPQVTSQCHVCEWEKIDIDVLGCTLCGKVHKCAYGSCTNTIETGDGLVCEFSGVVVYTKRFVETEFMDTLCVSGVEMPDLQQTTAADVTQIVTTLLCSQRNTSIKRTSLAAILTKCSNNCDRRCHHKDNMMLRCVDLLVQFGKTPYVFSYVATEERQRLVVFAVENCCRVFHILVKHGMCIRGNEVQRLAVGIVYLMRFGVFMDGLVVLPRIMELNKLLPPESSLFHAYGVHPKYITEMENRLKFCLRHPVK
jgi:hypothetical protein